MALKKIKKEVKADEPKFGFTALAYREDIGLWTEYGDKIYEVHELSKFSTEEWNELQSMMMQVSVVFREESFRCYPWMREEFEKSKKEIDNEYDE